MRTTHGARCSRRRRISRMKFAVKPASTIQTAGMNLFVVAVFFNFSAPFYDCECTGSPSASYTLPLLAETSAISRWGSRQRASARSSCSSGSRPSPRSAAWGAVRRLRGGQTIARPKRLHKLAFLGQVDPASIIFHLKEGLEEY